MYTCKCLNISIEILNYDNLVDYHEYVDDKCKFFNRINNDKPCKKIVFGLNDVSIKLEISELVQIWSAVGGGGGGASGGDNSDQISTTTTSSELGLDKIKGQQEQWKFFRCMNCYCTTYGLLEEKKLIMLNGDLKMTNEEILMEKRSPNFSPIFNITILDINRKSLQIFATNDDQYGSEAVAAVGGTTGGGSVRSSSSIVDVNGGAATALFVQQKLEKLYKKCLVDEMRATEKRIAAYRDAEMAKFNEFKCRVGDEFKTLVTRINQAPDENTNFTNVSGGGGGSGDSMNLLKLSHLDTPPTTPDSLPIECSPPFKQQKTWSVTSTVGGAGVQKTGASSLTMKTNKLSINKNQRNSNFKNGGSGQKNGDQSSGDGMCIFELEGLEYENNSSYNDRDNDLDGDDEDLEDADELDDGIANSIRQYAKPTASMNLAKSLPICIPVMGERFMDEHDADDDENIIEGNVDIAASIKALAKSVHGDTVFGDLPRPRFSTKI